MSAWDGIKKAFTTSPQQRHAEIQAQQVAEGKAFQCGACGHVFYMRRDAHRALARRKPRRFNGGGEACLGLSHSSSHLDRWSRLCYH